LKEEVRFHAQWRREYPTQAFREEYLVMDALGRGRLLGFVYGVRLYDDADRWSHGGAENIYIDGEAEQVFLRGSGGEDTFGTSYGGALHAPETHLYVGIPYYYHEDVGQARPAQRLGAYRFFEEDEIRFKRSIHFRFGCVANDISSTAYWYQTEPTGGFSGCPHGTRCCRGRSLDAESMTFSMSREASGGCAGRLRTLGEKVWGRRFLLSGNLTLRRPMMGVSKRVRPGFIRPPGIRISKLRVG